MTDLEFHLVDKEAVQFCQEVIEELSRQFNLSKENATRLVNMQWHGLHIGGPGEILFHDEPEYWAARIFAAHRTKIGV